MASRYSFYKNPSDSDSYSLRGDARPKCLFLAEGLSEALFLERWLTILHAVPEEVAVVCFKGNGKLDTVLKKLVDDSNFAEVKGIGFFLDAEGGTATHATNRITQLLRKFSVLSASESVLPGTLFASGIKIAVFVSPDNASSGFIEHKVLQEVAAQPLSSCVDAFADCVLMSTGNEMHAKGIVQAYLSARNHQITGVGRGFEASILDVMHTAYDDVRTTLSPLFT